MRVLIPLLLMLLLCLACAEGSQSEEAPVSNVVEVENTLPAIDFPGELDSTITGSTVLICVGSQFYDPEFFEVRRLLLDAGAEVRVVSQGERLFGLNGSEVLVDYQLEELDERVAFDALYLMQSRGMEHLAKTEIVQELVRRSREEGAFVAASGIAVEALAGAGILEGVRVAPYAAKRRLCEEAGAVIVEDEDVVFDEGIGTAVFWPHGGYLVMELIVALASS